MDQHPHDYRLKRHLEGVVLVVRPGRKYGGAGPGVEVLLDAEELLVPSTMATCTTREALDKAAAEREAAAAARAAAKKKGSLQSAVEEGLAKLSRDAVETAKAKAERETAESAAILARAEAAEAAEVPDVFAEADRALLPGGLKRAARPGGKRR